MNGKVKKLIQEHAEAFYNNIPEKFQRTTSMRRVYKAFKKHYLDQKRRGVLSNGKA